MANFSRNHKENVLKDLLKKAEKNYMKDPKIKKMVKQLRNLYMNDKDDFLFALGMAPPPAQKTTKKKPTPPPSRIPQLLMILDAVAKSPSTFSSMMDRSDNTPPSLLAPFPPADKKEYTIPEPPPFKPSEGDIRAQVKEVDKEMNESKDLFWSIKKEEKQLRARQGKYAVSVERLRAERLLRELPGKITQLAKKKLDLLNSLDEKK